MRVSIYDPFLILLAGKMIRDVDVDDKQRGKETECRKERRK